MRQDMRPHEALLVGQQRHGHKHTSDKAPNTVNYLLVWVVRAQNAFRKIMEFEAWPSAIEVKGKKRLVGRCDERDV